MSETNHAYSRPNEAWADILEDAPTIPEIPAPKHTDWNELGCYHWLLACTTGRFGDDEEPCRIARNRIEQLLDHLTHLDAEQLRNYISGLHAGIDQFMFAGV